MKKALISILIILTCIITITVQAKEKKIYELTLPSNGLDSIDFKLNSTILDVFMINPILEKNYIQNSVKVNNNGKEIVSIFAQNNSVESSFKLLDGVTKEDCLLEITDDLISTDYNIFLKDYVKQYDAIQISVKEVKGKDIKDTLIMEIPKDPSKISIFTYERLLSSLNSKIYDNINEETTIYTSNSKEIFKMINNYDFVENQGSQKREITSSNVTIPSTITPEDDIIIELTDEIKEKAKDLSLDYDNYSKFILAFSDKEYTDNTSYVFRLSEANKDNYTQIENMIKLVNFVNTNSLNYADDFYFYNNNKRIIKLGYSGIPIPLDDVTYQDNIDHYLDDSEKEKMKELGVDINRIIIKVANPIFIAGNNQDYSPNSENKLSFKLNIPYDKLSKSQIYIDNTLVETDNYETFEDGSIIFKKEYVNSMKNGQHQIKLEVIDGEATTNFNISTPIINPIIKKINNIIENPDTGKTIITKDKIIIFILLFIISIIGINILKKNNYKLKI